MHETGAPKPAESQAKFAELMRKVAEVAGAATFEELVKEVYGVPLSASDNSAPSLEWSYLNWLAKK